MRVMLFRRVCLLRGLATSLLLLSLPLSWGCARRKASPCTIRVSGAWALYPLMLRWADVYSRAHPEVRIEVNAGGAGKGMADCLAGQVDIAMLSRDVRPEESAKGAVTFPVARDAVFAMLSASHPQAADLAQTGLPRQALVELFLGGTTSRLPGTHVFTRSDACGAAETWAKYLGGRQEDLKGTAVFGDPGIAEAVRKDGRAIGYNNLAFAFDSATGQPAQGLAVLSIDANQDGHIDPTERVSTRLEAIQAIQRQTYPSRELLLVTRGIPQNGVKAFIQWIQKEGQPVAREAGFVPLARP